MLSDPVAFLKSSGVRFLRVAWCDNANVLRAKGLHVAHLPSVGPHGVGVSFALQAVTALTDTPVPDAGVGPVGEARLVPDWETLTPLPYAPGHARVFGDLIAASRPWPLCPREFLRQQVSAVSAAGLEVRAAFESEFYLLRPHGDDLVPTDRTLFAQSVAFDIHRPVVDAIAGALQEQGVPVEQSYPESGPGQQEITVRHAGPLAAADRQLVLRDTVHAVARAHDLRASFLPKPFEDAAGSGCHLHLSLWRAGRNITADPTHPTGLSVEARGFAAGLLDHMPALMAVTTPSPNSYRRIRPHAWAGAFRCWGRDNKEAALRVPGDPESGGATHFELKPCDGAANPYLALGVVLAAGVDGLARGLDLPPGQDADPGNVPGSERLPASLDETLAHFDADTVLATALGEPLRRAFAAVRRAELAALAGYDLATEARLLADRY